MYYTTRERRSIEVNVRYRLTNEDRCITQHEKEENDRLFATPKKTETARPSETK